VDETSVRHVAKPLYHRSLSREATAPPTRGAVRRMLEDHVGRKRLAAAVEEGLLPGAMRVKTETVLPAPVAVILRSADGLHQHRAARRTRDDDLTIYELTQGSLHHAGDPNSPVKLDAVDAEILVFVNGPVECFNHVCFEELRRCTDRGDCGLAGPLVLDPAGNILSAGALCTAAGGVRDPFRGLPLSTTAHMELAKVTRSVASISTRCFAISKSRLRSSGGLASLPADDLSGLCERLVKAAHADGLKVLQTPYAVVMASDFDPAPALSVCAGTRAPRFNPNLETFASITGRLDDASDEAAYQKVNE